MADSSSPTHLLARADDRRSLCGIKDALPRMLAKFVEEHRANYELIVCADCEAKPGDFVHADHTITRATEISPSRHPGLGENAALETTVTPTTVGTTSTNS